MTDFKDQLLLDRLADAAREGKISRRSFMHYAAAAGLTTTAATGLWTGAAKAQPAKGGTFRLGMHDGNTSDSHDPGTYVTFSMIQVAHTYRSYLTLIEPDGSLGPDVASEWSASPDAKEWTYKINENATFHSGPKVTAKDVIASMNHHRGDDTTSAAKALLSDVQDITDNGDNSVTFVLGTGNADLPWLMTDYHLAIVPANEDGTANWQSGDGCGPYKMEEAEFGVRYSLTRHEGWHLEGAYFDDLQLIVLNDPNARQTALVTGDVDAVTQLELKTLALLQRDPNIEIDDVPSAAAITLPMLCDTAPFDNVDVRNALKLSMNRDELIEKITFGAATKANDFHHSPAMPYYPEGIEQREYDPDQAKSLLKKAGAEGLTVNLSVADSVFSGAVDMCVLYAEHAKAAGITINVNREPNDGYYSDVWLKKPWCAVQWGARPTPDVMYSLAYKSDAAWNESRWQNERFNELLLQAKAELDDEKRAEMYREMAILAKDDGGTVIPFFPNFVYARRKNVQHGPDLAPSWQMDGARACSRWWFADA
ncbi:ABC transporter substrate-binding protein [Roseovarius atlanticus]|uniref:ABC transporter substrate-binding protein n=1 Tax=Roseovarius atlanticus TaxID=1641875 RepID=UPI001C973BE5|nr:ABC transporter substrate-binding protein [Roseovarius atlanticus]MBY5990175.1 ABC transporter substrate-binding protein [Roseovarius atlanticus]MBY6126721.1 ABC transporter substrate-binding protein [Roseovarius atlanticus]MBY6151215.1 ABC transporter substrate-binding protein [Roseovarius atlanticus]